MKTNIKVKDFLTKDLWIYHVYGNNLQEYYEAKQKVYKDLNLCISRQLFEWNDAPERTFEDVHNLCVKLDI